MIHQGDCIEVMAGMEPDSIAAIVTDPPYLLQFMGKEWDSSAKMSGHATPNADVVGFYQAIGKGGGRHDGGMDNWRPHQMEQWHARWCEAALRVAKPGAYLLAFGGTRTVHRMTCAIEDAGWVIRDMLVWAYAQGFPKSKASLKPAWEPIVLARKPGRSTDLQIDAARIPSEPIHTTRTTALGTLNDDGWRPSPGTYDTPDAGRWPANILLTDPIFDGGWDGVVGGGEAVSNGKGRVLHDTGSRSLEYRHGASERVLPNDSGTYSRFFLVPKASRSDREPILSDLPERHGPTLGISNVDDWTNGSGNPGKPPQLRRNTHPTVKPLDLMRHLVRLVTPPGGTILDPFLGSGTTGIACELEGFDWIGIEREAEYVAIAEARLAYTQRGMGLTA